MIFTIENISKQTRALKNLINCFIEIKRSIFIYENAYIIFIQ